MTPLVSGLLKAFIAERFAKDELIVQLIDRIFLEKEFRYRLMQVRCSSPEMDAMLQRGIAESIAAEELIDGPLLVLKKRLIESWTPKSH